MATASPLGYSDGPAVAPSRVTASGAAAELLEADKKTRALEGFALVGWLGMPSRDTCGGWRLAAGKKTVELDGFALVVWQGCRRGVRAAAGG